MLKVMSNPLNTTEKREKIQSKGLQKKSNKQEICGIDTELSSGVESVRELSTKKAGNWSVNLCQELIATL